MGQEHKERKPVEILLDEKRISDPAGVATAFKNYFVDSVASIVFHRHKYLFSFIVRAQPCVFQCL